ncbi:MAG: hypothetical protein FJW38_17025 [Acidobacteria bacterium]|nr:hypothetical protein [Acidobacteriota bacterium]
MKRRVAIVALLGSCAKPAPKLLVVPASWTFIEQNGLNPIDEEIVESLIGALDASTVIAWTAITTYKGGHKTAKLIASELGAAKILAISCRGGMVTAFLVENATAKQLWAASYSLTEPKENAAEIARNLRERQLVG